MRIDKLMLVATFLFGAATLGAQREPAPEAFDPRHEKLQVAVDFAASKLNGSMTFDMQNWTKQPASNVSFIVHRLMEASRITDGSGAALSFTQDVLRFSDEPMRQVTQIKVTLPRPIAPGQRTTLKIYYGGYLTPYSEIGWLYVKDHIDTAFTILRRDALAFPEIGGLSRAANRQLPYPDFTYEAEVRVPPRYVVATGGTYTKTVNGDGTTTWRYTSAGTTPFLNISVAPFDSLSAGGAQIFYFPADSVGGRWLANSAQIALRSLAEWFGPLHKQAKLTITEIPDGWGSQAHLVGGIIQTASAFRDTSQVGQLYHELTHLWNAVDRDKPAVRWNEGLATFLESYMRERLNGWTDRREHEANWITRMKRLIAADSAFRTVPFIEYGTKNMTNASYSVGNLMFAALHDLVGAAEFNKIVGGYYQQFVNGGTTQDFIGFARRSSTHDLSKFFDDWMLTTRWNAVVANANSVSDIAAHYRAPFKPITGLYYPNQDASLPALRQ